MHDLTELLDKLKTETVLSRKEYILLIENRDEVAKYAAELAGSVRDGKRSTSGD